MLEPHIRVEAKEPLVMHATYHMDAVHDLTYMHYAVPRIEVDGASAPPGHASVHCIPVRLKRPTLLLRYSVSVSMPASSQGSIVVFTI